MRLTVLGGCGAWPEADRGCSGYLVEHDGFRLLIDPGYATVPRLLQLVAAGEVDAVFVSHGHPDHCADLNPLLRARAMGDEPVAPLPAYAPAGALDAVLALDRPQTLAGAYEVHVVTAGAGLEIGPFRAGTWLLPHWLPNVGIRLAAGDRSLAYTGDSGPAEAVTELARGTDLLLAEATYDDRVPDDSLPYLSSAADAGRHAARAGAGRLTLTHLQPGTSHDRARDAAAAAYDGDISVAAPGLVIDLQ